MKVIVFFCVITSLIVLSIDANAAQPVGVEGLVSIEGGITNTPSDGFKNINRQINIIDSK